MPHVTCSSGPDHSKDSALLSEQADVKNVQHACTDTAPFPNSIPHHSFQTPLVNSSFSYYQIILDNVRDKENKDNQKAIQQECEGHQGCLSSPPK